MKKEEKKGIKQGNKGGLYIETGRRLGDAHSLRSLVVWQGAVTDS